MRKNFLLSPLDAEVTEEWGGDDESRGREKMKGKNESKLHLTFSHERPSVSLVQSFPPHLLISYGLSLILFTQKHLYSFISYDLLHPPR